MKTITVRGIEIGTGIPKIIVPIVGMTAEDILSSAAALSASDADIAEWRADYYGESFSIAQTLDMLKSLHDALGDKPLLLTFRTSGEGGVKDITEDDYFTLNTETAKSKYADLIDVEASSSMAAEIIKAAHDNGCAVAGSYHDFKSTPSAEEIIMRLRGMQKMGMDIPKIAVMPKNAKDVLTLLEASEKFKEKYADRPFMAISMGALGTVSRYACESFGSSLTFASIGEGSAPGQLPVEELARMLETLHIR